MSRSGRCIYLNQRLQQQGLLDSEVDITGVFVKGDLLVTQRTLQVDLSPLNREI